MRNGSFRVEKSSRAPRGAVEESVRNSEVAGFELFCETTARRNGNYPFDAQFLEPVDVGFTWNARWKQAVTWSMAREESNPDTMQSSCENKRLVCVCVWGG